MARNPGVHDGTPGNGHPSHRRTDQEIKRDKSARRGTRSRGSGASPRKTTRKPRTRKIYIQTRIEPQNAVPHPAVAKVKDFSKTKRMRTKKTHDWKLLYAENSERKTMVKMMKIGTQIFAQAN